MAHREADVIVVGAGVIGCTIAFELASTGRRVRVLEARVPGGGATRASAGVLAPYVEGHDLQPLRSLGRRSLGMYEALVARVCEASGLRVELRTGGTLEVATHESDVRRLEASAALAHAEGVATEWLDATQVRQAEPLLGPQVIGALRIPSHAAVDVQALTAAALTGALALGAELAAGRVTRIAADGTLMAVYTDHGVERAPNVVLAAGAWSASLGPTGADPLPVRPVRGQLLCLSLPPDTLQHVVWATGVYLVPWSNGSIFVGATSEDVGFDERTTAGGVAGLLAQAIALVPSLADATFSEARVGLRPASPDELPLVGPSQVLPGLFYACGHYRNGALLAPLTAAIVGRLLAGDRSDPALALLAPSRAGRL